MTPLLRFILEYVTPSRNIGVAVEDDDADAGDAVLNQL
jgi:hypothetical protein